MFPVCSILLLLVIPDTVRGESSIEFINSKAYRNFPKLFVYDAFDDCRAEWGDQFRYCIVRSPLVSNDSRSVLWQNMTKFSSSPRHYNHTILERGICVPSCVTTRHDPSYVSTEIEGAYLKQCVNEGLGSKYDLRVDSTTTQYCYQHGEDIFRIGPIHIVLTAIICGVIVTTIASSLYDRYRQVAAAYPADFYTTPPTCRFRELLVSFSLLRNLHKMLQPTDVRFRADLQVMEPFRVVRMFLIVFLHSSTAYMKLPQHNTDFLERYNHSAALVGYVARFQDSVQTFFLISAILLTVGFLRDRQNGVELDVVYVGRCIVNRLLRLLPVYAFVMLLQVAALPYFADGPFGRQFIGEAATNCRNNWWTNVLFINNYLGADQPCLLQSWYLAADMQLYICCILTLTLVWRYRRLKGYIFTLAIAYGLLTPAAVAYFRDTTPVMEVDMKHVDNYMRLQPYQAQLYFPFHLNFAVYFGGVLVGSAYYRYRNDWGKLYRSSWFKLFALLSCVTYPFTFVTLTWFVEHYSTLDRSLVAVYATIFKHGWGYFNALLFLVLFSLPLHHWIKQLLRHPIIIVVGRLSYSVYLLHFTVIVVVFGQLRAPVMSTEFIVSTYVSQIVLWTYTLSLGLCVLIELPTANITKLLLARPSKSGE